MLPLEHVRLLSLTNGMEVYAGYFRLFGLGACGARDAALERPGLLAAGLGGRADGCGASARPAWGDQYAYAGRTIRWPSTNGVPAGRLRMDAEPIAAGFVEFLRDVLCPKRDRPP